MSTLRRLEYFVSVVEHGSFTAAASVLSVSQPGLSHQLKALEGDLGGRLVDRGSRSVRLTPLGRAVLPHAKAAVDHARRVGVVAAAALDGSAGRLNVATINSLSLAALPHVLAEWRTDHPGVEIRLQEFADVPPLLDAFDDGASDVAVTPLPENWSGPRRHIGTEELVLAVPFDHPVAARSSVRFADLAEERWVHFTPDHGLAGVLEHVARLHGFRPRAAMRTSQTAAAPRYVAAGVGLALLPANLVSGVCAGVSFDPPITRDVYVLTRSDPDPLTAAFADCIAEHLPL